MINYQISGLNDRKAVKRHLQDHLRTYKLPAYISTDDGQEYYAEESNITRGAVLVVDRKWMFEDRTR